MFTVTVSVVRMTGAGWIVVVAVFRFWSAVSAASVSTPGSLWAHKPIFDNKMVSSVSAKAYHDVTHPITCMATCPPNSTCNAVFYSESEVKCVTCPYPCQQASLVTASGFRFYGPQRVLQCPTQMGYYHYDDTDVCLKLYTDQRTRYDAQLFCQLDGGHLFDFNTDQEFDNLEDYLVNVIDAENLAGANYYWVGATDEVSEGVWLWTDGTLATDMVLKYFDLTFSQPDGGADQNGLLIRKWNRRLHDHFSSDATFYLCEIDLS